MAHGGGGGGLSSRAWSCQALSTGAGASTQTPWPPGLSGCVASGCRSRSAGPWAGGGGETAARHPHGGCAGVRGWVPGMRGHKSGATPIAAPGMGRSGGSEHGGGFRAGGPCSPQTAARPLEPGAAKAHVSGPRAASAHRKGRGRYRQGAHGREGAAGSAGRGAAGPGAVGGSLSWLRVGTCARVYKCLCMYLHMSECARLSVHVHVCTCAYMHVHVCPYAGVCPCTSVPMCACVSVCPCMCTCLITCACLCICVHTCSCVHACVHMHACMFMCANIYPCMCMNVRVQGCMHAQGCAHACMSMCVPECAHACVHACLCACMRLHACLHVHMRVCV